jgi:hypothetical protein
VIGKLRSRSWLGLALVSVLALGVTYFVGVASGGLEIDEACAAAGQPVDDNYRAQHWQEPGRFFPLHNKCNADYDLVPGWTNPALVILAVLAALLLLAFCVSLTTTVKRRITS